MASTAALVSLASPASAATATTGTVSITGDPGDWVTGGSSYKYNSDADDVLTLTGSQDNDYVRVGIEGANGDWWTIEFAAPEGQVLAAGTYTDAQRYPFQPSTRPGLDYSGNGRGCNELGGTFTIETIKFGPRGYVEQLDATFEQHCEFSTSAARGEIHLLNPPPPAELTMDIAVSTNGTASAISGKATISGTVDCSTPVRIQLNGRVTQVKHNVLIRGDYSTSVDCVPGAGTAWTAVAEPTGTTPFQRGLVEVTTHGWATDPHYGNVVQVDKTTVVRLDRIRT
ncbi:hypothetical protein [Saccharothrix variisporea]|uniref:hypothetical protein n=1 Tax=Saccharothrix variisporea TaxID=543527 RepID=UPI001FE705F7|nr:hypothetical protein [Saccharothrix variisporea]